MSSSSGWHIDIRTLSGELFNNTDNVEQYITICDPVQQKGHDVGLVHSEIMSKTVCKI